MVEQRERISALLDGEYGDDAETAAQWLRSEEGSATWETYVLIGDALRGERPVSAGFQARVAAALESEPTVLAPRPKPTASHKVQWFSLAAAASVAGIATVVWLSSYNQPATVDGGGQVAGLRTPAAATQTMPVVTQAGPDEDEYIRVHQEVSPTAAMHGVASYIRTVSTHESEASR